MRPALCTLRLLCQCPVLHGIVRCSGCAANAAAACGGALDLRVDPSPVPPSTPAPAGKLELFANRARIVHIDIDPAEIHKNKEAHVPICADVKPALQVGF